MVTYVTILNKCFELRNYGLIILSRIWLFGVSLYVTCGVCLANLHGNGHMRACKNSTHSSLTCIFSKEPAQLSA